MKIEDQVVSRELAKKMKELGVKQDSIWFWITTNYECTEYKLVYISNFNPPDYCYSAFTVAELGEMLPDGYRSYYYSGHPSGGTWMCNDNKIIGIAGAETEADARAKMVIYLIKEGIIVNEPI